MSKPQRISISAAARLLGKSRMTIADRVCGLPFIIGEKGARLYDADSLMSAVYIGRDNDETIWEETDAIDLAEAMDAEKGAIR